MIHFVENLILPLFDIWSHCVYAMKAQDVQIKFLAKKHGSQKRGEPFLSPLLRVVVGCTREGGQ